MNTHFDELERQARALPLKEKAALARLLIDELDASSVDPDAENLWIGEAERRYDAFLRGDLEARSGDDVMRDAHDRLE